MLVIFPVVDRIKLLPYFFAYYTSIGASEFICALYNGEANPLYSQILSFVSSYNLKILPSICCDFREFRGAREVGVLNQIREQYAVTSRWYCIADLDEFHFFRGRNLMTVAENAERCGYEAVHGTFFDRIAIDGSFPDIEGKLDDKYPMACDLSNSVGLSSGKITLAKSHVAITAGHHNAKAVTWFDQAEVHHFKWVKGVHKIVRDKYARYSAQGLPWAKAQLPRLLRSIETRIDISDPRLKVRPAAKLGV